MEMNYTSKATGTAALTTGIIGTVLGAASGAGGLLNVHGGTSGDQYVGKEAYNIQLQLIDSEKRNAILQADLDSERKMVEIFNATSNRINTVRDELSGQIRAVEAKVDANAASQGVVNATVGAQVGINTSQIAQLMQMTKMVIPNSSVCPGWGNVTITPAAAGTTTA